MRKKLFLGGVTFVISIIVIILIITKVNFNIYDKDSYNLDIYYISSTTNQLVSESSLIDLEDNEYDTIKNTMELLKTPPETQGLITTIPEELQVLDYILNDNILQINFSSSYNDLKETDEIFCRAALVWTFTGLDFINGIEILVDGEPLKKSDNEEMGILNRSNVLINPTIDPDKINLESVNLYFSDIMGLYLVPETRTIEVKQSESIESQIIEQLILGPETEDLFSTLPPETKIRNIKTEEGICYVDLSSDFITKHSGGSSAEILTIYSIVNSLTDLDYVNSVQFLIEGEKVNTLGELDISKTFERNEDLISLE